MFRCLILLGAVVAVPLAAAPARALDADAAAKAVAPFIDSRTVAVLHVRASRITPAVLDRIAAMTGWDRETQQSVSDKLDGWKAGMERASADSIFVLINFADHQHPFALVIPGGPDAKPKSIGEAFRSLYPDLLAGAATGEKGTAFLAGSKAMVAHLKTTTPEARPELAQAIAAAGDTDVQVLLTPSKDQRRVIAELWLTFPRELGNRPTKLVTDGMQWAALGLNLGTMPTLKLTVQARDAETAKALSELHTAALDLVGKVVVEGLPLADVFGTEFAAVRKALVPAVKDDQMIVTADEAALVGGLLKIAERARDHAARREKVEKLKTIGLALHNYLNVHNRFPGRAGYGIVDAEALKKQGVSSPDLTTKPTKDAKPLLSWRVYMLPYLEQDALYRQFKLDEPWDSDHNKKLIPMMPAAFRSGTAALDAAGKTRVLAPVGAGLMFEPDGPGARIADIGDGTSNTILVVQAAEESAVVWTKPDDLTVDEKDVKKGVFGPASPVALALFADGSVHTILKTIEPKTLRAMFTRNGGEVFEFPR